MKTKTLKLLKLPKILIFGAGIALIVIFVTKKSLIYLTPIGYRQPSVILS